ncbi:hypothetical protein ACHQM5_028761 [Ranunculus cassubicifolius]
MAGNTSLKKKTTKDQGNPISSTDFQLSQVYTEETMGKGRGRPRKSQRIPPGRPSMEKKGGNPPLKNKTTKDQSNGDVDPTSSSEETVVTGRGRPRKSQRTQAKPSPTAVTKTQYKVYETRLNNIENNVKDLQSKWEQGIADLKDLVAAKVQSVQSIHSTEMPIQVEEPCLSDIKADLQLSKYKNICALSEYKNDELQNENYDLQKKLETALAKLEGYERGQQVISESFGKMKDAYFASYLTKTAEKATGMSFITDEANAPEVQPSKPKGKKHGKKVAQDKAPDAPATDTVAVRDGN